MNSNKKNISDLKKQRLVEYFKCKEDPIYFMEKYVKLSLAGGDRSVKLYDKQKEFIKEFYAKNHIIVLKTRQTGLSTISQMLACHLVSFYKNVVIGVISKSGAESTDFCRHVLSMIDSLPAWLKPEFDKRTEQTFILKNGSKFYSSQVNDANPEGTLRGKSLTLLILDESAFVSKIDEAYTSMAPTLFKAQQLAKQENIPYGTIIISTPNKTIGKGKWYYQNWVAAQAGRSIFHPFKLHWKDIPEFANDPNWYKTQCDILNNVEWKIAQELDMQFVASSNSFFPSDTIKSLNKCGKEPIHKMNFYKTNFNIFEQPDANKFYLIGVDTASEGGSDSSTIVVCEYETLNQVAEYKAANIRVEDFCDAVSKVSTVFSNNLLIVESNSYGNQVCEYLTRRDSYYNLYMTKQKTATIDNSRGRKKNKYRYGLYTGPQNRPLIIDALYTFVVDDPSIIRSELLALELIGLVDNNGKVQADEGEKDDLAMAFGFCCYVKLYDPPMGISLKFTDRGSMEDFHDIAAWNNIGSSLVAPEITSLKDINAADRLEFLDRSNSLMRQLIKSNLGKMMGQQKSNSIDMLDLIDYRNEKTGGFPN